MQTSARSAVLDLPAVSRPGVLHGVITDIRRILDGGSPAAEQVAAISACIADRVPGEPGSDSPPIGRLAPGCTPEDAAGMIAAVLSWRPGPATGTFAELTGHDITAQVISSGLDTGPDGSLVYTRTGLLMAGPLPCARVRLELMPDLLPAAAWGQIAGGAPCGAVLGPWGLARGSRQAVTVPGGDPAVRSSAVLWLCGVRIGAAAEDVTAELCAWLAREAGRPQVG